MGVPKISKISPNPKVARVAFLSRPRGVPGDWHSYRDRIQDDFFRR